MRKPIFFLFFCFALWQTGCIPPSNEKLTDVKVDWKDPLFQKIHDFQDKSQLDSLYLYFRHPDPTYRYLAAGAFASIRDSASVDSLAILLKDEVPEVRAAAAYSLGQQGAAKAEPLLMQAFERTDTAGVFKKSNRAILEAVGRCGSLETLKLLSLITTYQPKDTALLEGQTYGIYRFMIRELTSKEGTDRMIFLAGNTPYPESVRYIAASYLARAKIQIDSLAAEPLIQAINGEKNENIRMAMATTLGKAKTSTAMNALLQLYNRESDYRVKCNVLKALTSFPYPAVQATAMKALRDPQVQVANTAAQFFIDKGIAEDATTYWRLAKDTAVNWQAQVLLYGASLRHLSVSNGSYRDAINYELRRRFVQAVSPYHKAAILKGLSEWGWNFRFIQREGFAAKHPAVRTAAVEVLASLSEQKNYGRFFGASKAVAKELAIFLKQAIQSGDPGMVAVAAGALRTPERAFKTHLDTLGFMNGALTKLKLPQEIETYNELQHTLDFFAGKKFEARKLEYNHPIDWEIFKNLSADPKAVLRTKRGDLTLRLQPDIAPGSVANFVKLAKDGFFDGKNFHRVVANFVIQGGCPRGDGYGSLDYSIRSELAQVYYDHEGYLGMASAGIHTEGTQFFITHSPTPHLDGRYTIFGRVIEGMEVVHAIRIGDVIEKVIIQ